MKTGIDIAPKSIEQNVDMKHSHQQKQQCIGKKYH